MKRKLPLVVVILLAVAACGGGTGDTGDLGEEVFGGIGEASGDIESDDGGSSGGAEVGPVTQTADPGTGWVEVDGQRYEFSAFGSIHYRCEVSEDRITINFQQTESGADFLLQGSVMNGQWNAGLTFVPGEGDNVSYGANVGFDPGVLGIGDEEVSYEGTFSRVEDQDIVNAQDVQGTFAVNCSAADGEPTAVVGGESFTFPLSGAGSLDCVISDEGVQVLISHSQPEYLQLQVDVSDNNGEIFGAVYITSGDDTYGSFVPPDGTGLTIDGTSLTYEGVFTTPSGEEIDGSVSLSCG